MTVEARTLLLSQAYEPIKVVSWQRALTLLTLGKVEVLEEYDWNVRTTTLVIKVPAVIRLLRAFRRHKKAVKFSRANIYARDRYRCQYCGRHRRELGYRESLTRDHLVPISRGGGNGWTNVVTACSRCNLRKGNRLPEECGLKLRVEPHEPNHVQLIWAVRSVTPIQARYIGMFYGEEILSALTTGP